MADYFGTNGPNTFSGTDEADSLYGFHGADILSGGKGDDYVDGGPDADRLDGDAGDDFIFHGDFSDFPSLDVINGGGGNDEVQAGYSDDVNGRSGIDTLSLDFGGTTAAVSIDFSLLTAGGVVKSAAGRFRGFEYVGSVSLGEGDDRVTLGAVSPTAGGTLRGNGGDDRLTGSNVRDIISGSIGEDVIAGLAGNDFLQGGDHDDVISGGDDNDFIDGTGGDDMIDGGAGFDTMYGGDGSDIFIVDHESDQVFEFAETGVDEVRTTLATFALPDEVEMLTFIGLGGFNATGNGLANRIDGGAGADRLDGGDGNDRLSGFADADALFGGAGEDVLIGGARKDLLTGGADADIFRFAAGDSAASAKKADVVADFSRSEGDRIDLASIDAVAATPDLDRFRFIATEAFSGQAGELRYSRAGPDTLLMGDIDGVNGADFVIRLTGRHVLAESDLLLDAGENAAPPASPFMRAIDHPGLVADLML